MKLVLLCKRHNHRKAGEILTAFQEEGLSFSGIVALQTPSTRKSMKEVVRKSARLGLRGILNRLVSSDSDHNNENQQAANKNATGGSSWPQHSTAGVNGKDWRSSAPSFFKGTIDEFAQQHQIPIHTVADLNGAESEQMIRHLSPDLLILGGTPIIRGNILRCARVGTLNVHMAPLPAIRGMNVAEWSVFQGKPVTLTVHLVNEGVDTGAIVYEEQVEVADCRSIAAMRQKLSPLQHRVLAKATRMYIREEASPATQQRQDGLQYYLMHDKLRRIVEHKLRRGYTSSSTHTSQSPAMQREQ